MTHQAELSAASAVLAWRPSPAYPGTRCDHSPLVRTERMAVAVPWWAAEYMLLGALDKGYAPADLRARLGLPAAVHDQQRLPMQRYGRLLLQLSREMLDELIGLWRAPVPPGTFATVASHMLHCATLGEALRTGLRLYRLIAPGFPLPPRPAPPNSLPAQTASPPSSRPSRTASRITRSTRSCSASGGTSGRPGWLASPTPSPTSAANAKPLKSSHFT